MQTRETLVSHGPASLALQENTREFFSNKLWDKNIEDPVTSTHMHLPSHTQECVHTSIHSPRVSSTSTICLRGNIIVKEISKIRSCKFPLGGVHGSNEHFSINGIIICLLLNCITWCGLIDIIAYHNTTLKVFIFRTKVKNKTLCVKAVEI